MRRFSAVFFSVVSMLILVADLILIFIYGRRFDVSAVTTAECSGLSYRCGGSVVSELLMMDLLLISAALLVYLAVRRVQHLTRPSQ